jgi:hypothetical protein
VRVLIPEPARAIIAGRAGGDAPSQDRAYAIPGAVIVLDGASQPQAGIHDGGWIAQTLGLDLAGRLTDDPAADLAQVLYAAIDDAARRFGLRPGEAPSTTVSIVRWSRATVDVLVLGDTPVVVRDARGRLHPVRDDRLARLPGREGFEYGRRGAGFATENLDGWRDWVEKQRRWRNCPDGYWIAEADPRAARQAIRRQWPRAYAVEVLIATDGVADGIDRYRRPASWEAALELAATDPQALVDLVHETEDADPRGERWPRYKLHDDKTVAWLDLGVRG